MIQHGDRKGQVGSLRQPHGDRKPTRLLRLVHGDRKGPPNPTQPPSPLRYYEIRAPNVVSWGESGGRHVGGTVSMIFTIVHQCWMF